MRRVPPALVLALLLALALAPAAIAETLSIQETRDLNSDTEDPARTDAAMARLRSFLAHDPDSSQVRYVRELLVQGLITKKASGAEIVAAADSAAATMPGDSTRLGDFSVWVAKTLATRGVELEAARRYATRALALLPHNEVYASDRADGEETLGRVELALGRPGPAIDHLTTALPQSPDSQGVLLAIGRAHEKAGHADLAVDYYLRSAAVYLGTDSSAMVPLRRLYAERHGSLAGLEPRLEASRAASRRQVVFDAHRWERPAPDWTLPTLSGDSLSFASLRGKIVAIDFWGSWCPPCREELPHYEQLARRYRDRGVTFVSVNWERPAKTPEARIALARDFVRKHGLTFPVGLDLDRKVVAAFDLIAYPSLYLVDAGGTVRYRDVGYDDGMMTVITSQLDSMLGGKP